MRIKQSLIYIALSSSIAVAQANPSIQAVIDSPSYPLPSVVVSGSKSFAAADLIKATGLVIGSKVTADDLKRAGDRLSQSGVFSQVSYKFDGKTATYGVVDADAPITVTFENFVWFSDAELQTRIHASVPLFAGSVPLGGNLSDQVIAALDQLIKERRIEGHVVAAPDPAEGAPSWMRFRIDGVSVEIAQLSFPGATADHATQLQTAAKSFLDANYVASLTPAAVRQRLATIYGRLGYLKAQFAAPKLSMVKDDPVSPSVALEISVEEGPQYTYAGVDWSGNKAVSSEDLTRLVDVKLGTPADTSQLARVIALGKTLYGTKGYLYAQVKATATVDSEKYTAVLHLAVDEGPVYHMGKLEISNLGNDQADTVRRYFQIKPGDVYDSSYVKDFLKKQPKEFASLAGWNAQYTQTIHDDTQVVDLSLKFVKQ